MNRCRTIFYGPVCVCLALVTSMAFAQGGSVELHSMNQHPAVVREGQSFELHLTGYNIAASSGLTPIPPSDQFVVSIDEDIIQATHTYADFCFTPGAPLPPNDRPQRQILAMPGLPAGTYTLNVQLRTFCSDASLEQTLTVYPEVKPLQYFHESPSSGQVVSGVGVVRGWACYERVRAAGWASASAASIGRVAYQIDDYPLQAMPYGSVRTDTAQICGEQNSYVGYGAVTYWGLYGGAGEHTFTLYIDGNAVESFPFRVEMPPEGFRKGLEAQYTLVDFPFPGNVVDVQWSEADQNFIIVRFADEAEL